MNEYINNLHSGIFILLPALVGSLITIYIFRKKAFVQGSSIFRNAILDELSGIYPVVGTWSPDDYTRISNSGLNIKRAAQDFMPNVPFYRKNAFTKAVSNYSYQAEQATFDQAIYDAAFPPKEPTQKENIVHAISHLLSFTK